MFTRKQYINNECSHHEYYSELSEGAYHFNNAFLDRVKKALNRGDVHLNSIPLKEWDRMALPVKGIVAKRMEERGDFATLAGSVCALKAAAKNQANKVQP